MRNWERGASALAVVTVIAVVIAATAGAYLIFAGGDGGEQSASDNKVEASSMGVKVVIEPATDATISGTVDVTVAATPDGTNMVFFTIEGPGAPGDSGPNLGIDDSDSDGWGIEFDTSEYGNGSYSISGLAMERADSNPLGVATAEITIAN